MLPILETSIETKVAFALPMQVDQLGQHTLVRQQCVTCQQGSTNSSAGHY